MFTCLIKAEDLLHTRPELTYGDIGALVGRSEEWVNKFAQAIEFDGMGRFDEMRETCIELLRNPDLSNRAIAQQLNRTVEWVRMINRQEGYVRANSKPGPQPGFKKGKQ